MAAVQNQRSKLLQKQKKKTLRERAFERIDVPKELKRLYQLIEELRIEYDQFFLGITLYQPDKLQREVRLVIRRLRKAPFKKPRHKYRLRSLEARYHTYHDYWQRILRQREEGIYSKDVFKANLRERVKNEGKEELTKKGSASKAMQELFQSYKQAIEKQTGKSQNLDFTVFRKTLLQRAKAEQKRSGTSGRLSFKVVVKNGKVVVRAAVKSRKESAA